MPIFTGGSDIDASSSSFFDFGGNVNLHLHLNADDRSNFDRLTPVHQAAYNSSAREGATGCLRDTRVDVLQQIHDWIQAGQTSLFWLSGEAGTGKSTIAHSIAKEYDRNTSRVALIASFFFSRDQQARRQSKYLFQTIAFQLGCAHPELKELIAEALEDQTILTSGLSSQFQQLILHPISRMPIPSPIVIVLDALDECEDEEGVCRIIQLLTEELGTPLKILITSRPESHIRSTFAPPRISRSTHPFVLHEVRLSDVQNDIKIYVKHEMEKIADERREIVGYNPWPQADELELLVQISAGLFIVAATAIKFVRSSRASHDPRPRLKMILGIATGRGSPVSRSERDVFNDLDAIYTGVLSHAMGREHPSDKFKEFRTIVGTIVLAYGRLTVHELGDLLQLQGKVRSALADLHSVILVPEGDGVVHASHLSFHDYLTDKNRCRNQKFFIDAPQHHKEIAGFCLERMNGFLKRDMCNIRDPSKMNGEIDNLEGEIAVSLPGDVQYACRYWALHLSRYDRVESLFPLARIFFSNHVLHWLEVLSLIGDLVGGLNSLKTFHAVLSSAQGPPSDLLRLVHDTERFLLEFYDVISLSALQVYHSALLFTPRGTLLYEKFASKLSRDAPAMVTIGGDTGWKSWLRVMEGHSHCVTSVTLSHDNTYIISGSDDKTIRIWNARTGAFLRTLNGHSDGVKSVAMSHDDTRVISGSDDKTVRIWLAQTGDVLRTLQGHTESVTSVAISHDDTRIISGSSDATVRIWNAQKGEVVRTLEGHSDRVTSVAISHDDTRVISGSWDNTIRIWTMEAVTVRILKGHTDRVTSVAISHDDARVISGSNDKSILIWLVETGAVLHTLTGHPIWVTSVAISHDDLRVIAGSKGKTIRIWDTQTGRVVQKLPGQPMVMSVAVSNDGTRVISGSADKTIRIWDTGTRTIAASHKATRLWRALAATIHGDTHLDNIMSVAVSHCNTRVISGSSNATIRIWDARTGKILHRLEGHSGWVRSVAISHDDSHIISGSSDMTIRIWDARTGKALHRLKGHSGWVRSVAISHDDSRIISGSNDTTVRIWNAQTGQALDILEGHSQPVTSVAISRDNTLIISGSEDKTIRIWEAQRGYQSRKLEGHSQPVASVAISHNGDNIISGSYDDTIRIWDARNSQQTRRLVPPNGFSRHIENIGFSLDKAFIVAGGHSFAVPSQAGHVPNGNTTHSFRIQDGWIMKGEKKVCWVPPARRGLATFSQTSDSKQSASVHTVAFHTVTGGTITILVFPN